jgi:hypothetical protein
VREIAAANTWALPIFFTRRTAFFASRRYTIVWTVVYAGRALAGNACWICRTEEGPCSHRVSMIRCSSLVSFGSGTGRLLQTSKIYYTCS